ncbi:MAG: LCP family protein [Candidatus Bipolaricaulota bacterium]
MKWKIITGILVAVLVLGIAVSLYFVNRRNVEKVTEEGERVNLLAMGLDQVEGTSRSDTIMLVSISPNPHEVQVFSVPRDLYVKYPDGESRRINAAYPIGGGELARDLISDLTGVEIPFHLILDYEGFKELIDMIGGIELEVEERLEYEDTAASPPLEIDISSGQQVLDGEEALGYIRYRGEGSDIRRIDRQQKFLKALLEQGIQFREWTKLKDLISTAQNYLQTNLSLVDLYDLGKMVRGISADDFNTHTLPGQDARIEDKAVLQPRIVEIKRMITEGIHGVDLLTKSDIRVVTLNGEGSTWLAHNSANRLESLGFNVVGADNADRFDYETSYILDLVPDNPKKATMLRNEVSNELEIDVEIIDQESSSEALESIRDSGVTIPDNTDLILILGEGSSKLVDE